MPLVVPKDQPSIRCDGGDNFVVVIQRQVLMILSVLESRPRVLVLVGDATHSPLSIVGKEMDSIEKKGT